jgi:signal transduction histidine kinase
MNIDRKILYVFMGISILPLIIVSTVLTSYTHFYGAEQINDQTINQLRSLTSIQKSRLKEIYEHQIREMHLISKHSSLSSQLHEYLDTNSSESLDEINEVLFDYFNDSSTFLNLHIHDMEGIIIASTEHSMVGENHSTYEHYNISNGKGVIFANENGELRQFYALSIAYNETTIGTLTIKTDASDILSITGDYTGLYETGETVLGFKNANGDVIIINSLRHSDYEPLERVTPKEKVNAPMIQATNGIVRVFLNAKDYRNKTVIASTEYMNETGWGIVVKIDKEEVMKPVIDLTVIMVFGVLIASAIIIVVAIFFSKSITEPIKILNTATLEFGKGNYSVRAKKVNPDEIGELAETFNLMSDQIQEEIAKREVILSITSHDLLNYFTVADGFLEIMKMDEHSKETIDYIRRIKSNILQAIQLLTVLSVVLKEEVAEVNLEPIYLKSTVTNAFSLLEDLFPKRTFIKKIIIGEDDKIKGDTLFDQVLINLLTNAVRYQDTDKIIIEVIGERNEDKYCLSIIDHGRGINPQDREKVFTRFNEFRTTGKGSGLGLYIVKNLVEKYNGKIWIESRVEDDFTKGTIIRMEFPLE